jgi:hypothetical protein
MTRWLREKGFEATELDAPWPLSAWLIRLDAHTAMHSLGWDSQATMNALSNLPERRFVAIKPPADTQQYGNWDLPATTDRTYAARISVRHVPQEDIFGDTRFDIHIDLTIAVQLSPNLTKNKTLRDIYPHLVSPLLACETVAYLDAKVDEETFTTPEARIEARNRIIETAVDHHIQPLRATIKNQATRIAEQTAISIFHQHYHTGGQPTITAVPVQESKTELEQASHASNGSAVAAEDAFDQALEGRLNDLPDGPLTAPVSLPVKAAVERPAPGYRLLTYRYYHTLFSQQELSKTELENYTENQAETLASSGIRYLLEQRGLERSVALQFKPGLRRLLESPFYQQYFAIHLDQLPLAENITLEQASLLAIPYMTHLLTHHHVSLQTALTYTLTEMTVIRCPAYGDYLSKYPKQLGLLRGVNTEIRDFIVNATVARLFQQEKITLAEVRVLPNKLSHEQQACLTDPICSELFLQEIITLSGLKGMNPEQCSTLRAPGIVSLILAGVLTADEAKGLMPVERNQLIRPQTHQLLLAKKISPSAAKSLSPLLSDLVESQTYASALAEQHDFIAHLQTWELPALACLFHPQIMQLFTDKIITFTHFQQRTATFFPTLLSDRVFTLLIEGHIQLSQALALTPPTLQVLHKDDAIFNLLHTSTDNDGRTDYLPFKIWSQELARRLFAIYQNTPEEFLTATGAAYDAVIHIKTDIEAIAIGEKISSDLLRQLTVAALLKVIRDELKHDLKGIPLDRVPMLLTQVVHDIDRRCRGDVILSWVELLQDLAAKAKTTLASAPMPRMIRYNQDNHVAQLTHFHPTAKITPRGLRQFCMAMTEIGDLCTLAKPAPVPPVPMRVLSIV